MEKPPLETDTGSSAGVAAQLPSETTRPYDHVSAIQAARTVWSDRAKAFRKVRTLRAVVLASLGPVAVCLLAIQAVRLHDGGPVAIGLVGGEFLLLACGLSFALLRLDPSHHSWVRARVHAEVLRREEWLYHARLGPYLAQCGPEAEQERLTELKADSEVGPDAEPDIDALIDLIAMEHEDGTPWHHALEDVSIVSHSESSTLMKDYCSGRLQHQLKYFDTHSKQHERQDHTYEGLMVLCLAAALIAAAVHLYLLFVKSQHHVFADTVDVVALVLPPLGGALFSLRSVFEHRHLADSFRYQLDTLSRIEEAFTKLEKERPQLSDAVYLKALKRQILRCEMVLSDEMHRWVLTVWGSRPRGGG